MSEYKKYRRTNIAEMRPVNKWDLQRDWPNEISVSEADLDNGSPKIGDMIARNPNNHNDKWLVAEKYFKSNFESIIEDE